MGGANAVNRRLGVAVGIGFLGRTLCRVVCKLVYVIASGWRRACVGAERNAAEMEKLPVEMDVRSGWDVENRSWGPRLRWAKVKAKPRPAFGGARSVPTH